MPKAYINLVLKGKGAAEAKKGSTLKSPPGGNDDVAPSKSLGSMGITTGMRYPKVSANLYNRELDFEPLEPIGVQIMFMSEEELESLSAVVNIKQDEKSGIFSGSVKDERLFPHGNKFCSTCSLPKDFCPGHLGYISLVRPIINIWAYKYVVSVLESICYECGTLLMSVDSAARFSKGAERLKKIAEASKSLTCRNWNCKNRDQPNPTFVKQTDTMLKIRMKFPNNVQKSMSSSKILHLFKQITTEELTALGFPQNTIYQIHPKNLLFTKLPVIPENHRPLSIMDNEERPNALTTIYNKIIQVNNTLRNGIKDDRLTLSTLESAVCSIHNKDSDSMKNGNPNVPDMTKNINEILSRKKGVLRNNAQGKRCNHTARTVLTPSDPHTPFGWMRLPQLMSKILINERICDKNLKYYEDLLKRGLISGISTRERNIIAVSRHADFTLKVGMIVKRPLQNGDPIMFNRNPTLHKHSMMGYLARMAPGLTIGLHSSNTSPHNADFDGDEGNINVCPGYKARAEIIHLSGCWNNIVGSQFSRPMMGLVFNAITSSYLMSQYGVINSDFWNDTMTTVFSRSSRIDSLEERVKRVRGDKGDWRTGPALFSALLPENFNYTHNGVVIREGVLVKGHLKKGHVGPSTRSIVHLLYHNYGSQVASQFLSEGQAVTDTFIEYIGFTVGYWDCAMPNEESKVQDIVKASIESTTQQMKEMESLIGNPNMEIREFYDQSVKAALNTIKTLGAEIVKEGLKDNNALKIMADCGSKGKVEDVGQVIGVVGQQFVRSKRPAMIFNRESDILGEGLRFLPYYDVLNKGRTEKITSRGFVDRPLGKGMRPGQFFSHMMASRIGLIDTAQGTATTGYSQYNITKALEDMRYAYNGTICGDQGQVVQYAGGEDSYEPMEMVKVSCPGFGDIWSPLDIFSLVRMLNEEP